MTISDIAIHPKSRLRNTSWQDHNITTHTHTQKKVYDKLISENQTRSKSKVTQNDSKNVEMTIKL